MINIKFKKDETKAKLLAQIADKDRLKSAEAQEAFAAIIQPVAQEVIEQAGTSNLIFKTESYQMYDSPSIELDLFHDAAEGYVTVWSQPTAGGLATNQTAGVAELKLSEYDLDCAVSYKKKWARLSRLDVISKSISKMLQEVLIKQEIVAWNVFTRAVAEATTNGLSHVISATTTDVFQVDDLNRLMTRHDRINTAFNAGTPVLEAGGLTDLFVSPEIMEQIRAFAYQPMNTRAYPDNAESTAVPLPDNVRERIFNAAGTPEIYGVTLNKVHELGNTGRWNRLFDEYYTSSFTHGTDQVVFGANLSEDAALRLIATDEEGATFSLETDDQFLKRSDTAGFYGKLKEARVIVATKPFQALIV